MTIYNSRSSSAKPTKCAQKGNDVAKTSLIEVWIDQAERRTWLLVEIVSELQ